MAFIPRKNWHAAIEQARSSLPKILVVMESMPAPSSSYSLVAKQGMTSVEAFSVLNREVRDKIDSQPELVRRLERSRFRRPLCKHAALPHGVAERLEDFEAGLRSAGFIAVDEVLVQSFYAPLKFRVHARNVAIDGHFRSPSVKAAAPNGEPVPSLTEGPKPLQGWEGSQSRPESGACLDGDGGHAPSTVNLCASDPQGRVLD